MTDKEAELLHNAIARNVSVVLSLPSAGMLRHHKSRFLSESDAGIMIESPAGEQPLVADLIATAKPIGISFKLGTHKVMFASAILQFFAELSINEETKVSAVQIRWPAEIKSVQRRTDYRVEILPDSDVSIRVWRIADRWYYKEQPTAAQEVKAEVRNLSTGGVGVKFLGKDDKPPLISIEDRLRVQLKVRDQTLILEGRMRSPSSPANDNNIITGIQFKKMQNDLEGRKLMAQLTRVVGELQREEIRRMRLGLTQAG